MGITITLNRIAAHHPCSDGWDAIIARTDLHGGDHDREWPLAAVLDTDRPDDALWALRCLPEYDRLWRRYAVWCVRRVQHLMTDPRSINALDVAERHAHGLASDAEMSAAWEAASAAARDAVWAAASAAARAAASDARDARAAARAARAAQYNKLRQILTAGAWVTEDES